MMTWASIILKVLSLVQWMIEEGQRRKWIAEGEKLQIARASAEVLRKQEFANAAIKHISGLSDSGVDELLRSLEPEADRNLRQLLPDVQAGRGGEGGRGDSSKPTS